MPTSHAHKGGFSQAMNEALHMHRKDDEFHHKDGVQKKKAETKKEDPPGEKKDGEPDEKKEKTPNK